MLKLRDITCTCYILHLKKDLSHENSLDKGFNAPIIMVKILCTFEAIYKYTYV